MRKPKHRICLRVEAMESKALLSALAPLSTLNHADISVAEIRRHPHQQFSRASVRITNQTAPTLEVAVKAKLVVNNTTREVIDDDIRPGMTKLFNFGQGPPPNTNWSITIDVERRKGDPIPVPLKDAFLSQQLAGGYFGKSFRITLTGTTYFSVSV